MLTLDSLQDVFEDDGNIHLVMELCDGGGILDRMQTVPFTERQVRVASLFPEASPACKGRQWLKRLRFAHD